MIVRKLCAVGLVLVLAVLVQCDRAAAQEEAARVFLVSKDETNRDIHETEWGEGTAFRRIYVSPEEGIWELGAVNAVQLDPERLLHTVLIEEDTYAEKVVIDAGLNVVLRGVRRTGDESPGRPDATITWSGGGPVVTIDGTGSRVVLDTLNIIGGDTGVAVAGSGENETARPTIMNCIIRSNTEGIDCREYSGPGIINCMVVGNAGTGVVCHAESEPWLMNDTIADNQTGIEVLTELGLDITNTIAWGNPVGDIDYSTGELRVSFSDVGNPDLSGTNGNISADPWPTGHTDYELRVGPPSSPCIDAGTSAGALPADFEGDPRYDVPGIPPDGAEHVDIGADEFVPGTGVDLLSAYAIPDPTSRQPPGGLLIFVYYSGTVEVNSVDALSAGGNIIQGRIIVGGGATGFCIARNAVAINESTGDGWAQIRANGAPVPEGRFLIDTTPPTVSPGPPSPFYILDGGEGSWTHHNDFVDVYDLHAPLYWAFLGLPSPPLGVEQDVPNDGANFFFNTGAVRPGGTLADEDHPPPLWIDFVVDAFDPGTDPSGFGAFWAPSGRPVVRDEVGANPYRPDLVVPGLPGPTTTWTLAFRPTAEDVYQIEIVAEDRAGNPSLPVPLRVHWDKRPPETRITSGPRSRETSTQATFTWRLEGAQRPTYSTCLQLRNLAGGWDTLISFTPFMPSETATYTNLEVGRTYRFTVLAIDDAGNLETTVTNYNQRRWTVGNPVPDTVIVSGPPRVTTQTSARFVFKEVPDDREVYFQWKLEPLPSRYPPSEDPLRWRGAMRQRFMDVGVDEKDTAQVWVFSVRAWKDYNANGRPEGGEYDPTPATYSWTVIPPKAEYDVVPPGAEGDPTQAVGAYIDSPGEQAVKYMREEAR